MPEILRHDLTQTVNSQTVVISELKCCGGLSTGTNHNNFSHMFYVKTIVVLGYMLLKKRMLKLKV